MMPLPLLLNTFYTLILVTLLLPLISNLLSYPNDQDLVATKIKDAVKTSFYLSLVPLGYFITGCTKAVTTRWVLVSLSSFDLTLGYALDLYSLMFCSVIFYVTWSIMEYTLWYMESAPNLNQFFKYLLLFLLSMIILVTANNLLQLFIGWEGVGFMSFLLISWWNNRVTANIAAVQAVLYNRIGDIGFILAMVWLSTRLNSWDLSTLAASSQTKNLTLPLLGFILAAMGKSAQFGLHPWLVAAMEGPTPVSALLHSSTMVVAGIFLLIRLSPLIENSTTASSTCLCLGAITMFFMATCALTQNDLKKIIALSTSSQLGFMMVTVGLNQPGLAFLHICMHAFFKAMLFLCAASLIHSLTSEEQDIRKMGGLYNYAPVATTCLAVGSLALAGMPFLAGFFSKDAIIEAFNMSYTNAGALALTLIATIFTAAYSSRLAYTLLVDAPRHTVYPPLTIENPTTVKPLERLAYGSIFAGLIITSHVVPTETPLLTMPLSLKIAATLLAIVGVALAWMLASWTSKRVGNPLLEFCFYLSIFLGHVPGVAHRKPPKYILSISERITKILERAWLKKTGPDAMAASNLPFVSTTDNIQQGALKIYVRLFLLTSAFAILICWFPFY